MTLQEFSGGYYSLDMSIQPYSDGPVIDAELYDYIDRRVYSNTNAPVTFKLSLDNGIYFNVDAENGVPPSVLAIPEAWAANAAGADDGRRQTVFVLKPGYAHLTHQAELLKGQLTDMNLEEYIDERNDRR